MSYDNRQASAKKSEQLKTLKAELLKLSDRLEEMIDEVEIPKDLVKKFPDGSRAKSSWMRFGKAEKELREASTAVATIGYGFDMIIGLCELAEEDE